MSLFDWTKVSERLPEPFETVLLNCDGELRSTGFVNNEGKFSVDAEDLSDGSAWIVTHWMPLPECPKERGDD